MSAIFGGRSTRVRLGLHLRCLSLCRCLTNHAVPLLACLLLPRQPPVLHQSSHKEPTRVLQLRQNPQTPIQIILCRFRGRRREHLRPNDRVQSLGHIIKRLVELDVLAGRSPVAQAGQILQTGHQTGRIDNLQRAVTLAQQPMQHRLVLDRIHRARRVHQPSADRQQFGAALRNPILDAVQIRALRIVPLLPDVRILAQRSVARTRHIAQHPIEAQRLHTTAGRVRDPNVGQRRAVVIGHDEARRVQAFGLMHQHVAAIVVHIVGHHKAAGNGRFAGRVQRLDQLRRLGAGRRAHVQHFVMRLHIEHNGRYHRDGLLSADAARTRLGDEEVVQLVERLRTADVHARQLHLPGVLVRIPGQRKRLGDATILAGRGLQVGGTLQIVIEALRLDDVEQALRLATACGNAEGGGQIGGDGANEVVPLVGRHDVLLVLGAGRMGWAS